MYSPEAWCFHRRRPSQMSADTDAMVNRTITTLEKSLGYIEREPYRSMARARLAGLRYGAAMTDLRLDRNAALSSLRTARELDPERISSVPYAIAYAAVTIPGVRHVLKSGVLSAPRRAIGRALGVLD
jgi:hypothetical protein